MNVRLGILAWHPPVSGAVGWTLTPFSPISSLLFQDSIMCLASLSRAGGIFDKKDEVSPLLFTPCIVLLFLLFIVCSFSLSREINQSRSNLTRRMDEFGVWHWLQTVCSEPSRTTLRLEESLQQVLRSRYENLTSLRRRQQYGRRKVTRSRRLDDGICDSGTIES